MSVPEDLHYPAEHEWLTAVDGRATVGITAYAVEALDDIIYVELPQVGDHIEAGRSCGELESTKSVSDLYAPASGEVVDVNTAVADEPGLLNTDPYGGCWLFRLAVEGEPTLLSADEYAAMVASERRIGSASVDDWALAARRTGG
ncbi:MAG: glycine cleavage system protein GcvH [Actinophytocola sp.]|nr:glycine cleavage system protein GcvH [Actinophytocola sp.]